MPVEFHVNVIIGGILTGSVYGLMALGLSLVFGVMHLVNFAHGEMMVAGMYVAFLFHATLGVDVLAALPAVAAVLFLGGYALQRGLINRFVAKPQHQQFLLLVAVAMVLTNGQLMLFGPDARATQVAYAFDTYAIGPLLVDKVRLFAALIAVGIALLLYGFLHHTRIGKSIRACADNHLGALVVGLDVRRLYAFTFGIGAACVGAAGTLMVLLVDVHPHLAVDYTLLAFVIVIVGGLGSLGGALFGGILIGLSEALAGFLIAPSMKSMFSFGLLILILLLRPQGLFGKPSA
jgi:branched-chain amino acid transport system permease protein